MNIQTLLLALVILPALAVACAQPASAPAPAPIPTQSPAPLSTVIPIPTPGQAPVVEGQRSLLQLTVASVSPTIPDYDRNDWRHWVDDDRDCQDARQEVLIAESTISVTFESPSQCRAATGSWIGPYTGAPVDDPSALDVDHMVPLANAHSSGGWAWDSDRKEDYANYMDYEGHLIATTASANRSKGAKGPEDWRPPDEGYWCAYAVDWITIKKSWDLTATEREWEALVDMLGTCDEEVQIEVTTQEQPTGAPTVTSAPSVNGTPQPLRFDPNGPDRNCGDFDLWREAQDFYEAAGGPGSDRHRLDQDGNGIACESLSRAP